MAENDDPTLADVISLLDRNIRVKTHTIKPGIVRSYSSTPRPQAVIELGQVQLTRSGETVEYPPIRNVPVCFPTFGPFTIRAPLRRGNGVICLVADREFSRWMLQGGEPSPPANGMLHHYSHILALPVFNPNDREPGIGTTPNELVIGDEKGLTQITLNAQTGAVTVAGSNVTVQASGIAKIDATRIELDAISGAPSPGPHQFLTINAAGIASHVGANGAGNIVWTPNPAGQIVATKPP